MNRFMGMMPSKEIEKSATYVDGNGWKIHIDAGPNGWTIRYADSSSDFKDKVATTEENFQEAYDLLKAKLPEVKEINEQPIGEC